ncbi:MAG: CoA-binding protein, partial [Calditrichaeota bacterium]
MEIRKETSAPSQGYWRYDRQSLMAIFNPRSVAVVGASEKADSVGRTVLWNLISNPFGGIVFPVNPNRGSVLGIKAYPSITEIPEPVDLAVIVTPASTVPAVIENCVKVGVKGAVIISSGFREIGAEGKKLEDQILETAREGGLRILGPNSFGFMLPYSGLNISIGRAMAKPGHVAFLSQSGSLTAAVLDWSFREQVGFSAFISLGNMADIEWSDLIYFLGDDPHTHSIVMYLQSIKEARAFLSAAREVGLNKPIIALTTGKSKLAMEIAATQSGWEGIPDEVLSAAFRRCGILPVEELVDLFAMSEILAKQPRARGRRLAIVTNAGGPGVQSVDVLVRNGGELAPLSEETRKKLNIILPPSWGGRNPIHVQRDADADRFYKAVDAVLQDSTTDGVLVILAPQGLADPTITAEKIKELSRSSQKPLLASWMGGTEIAAGKAILNRANIPTFPFPDTAAQVFNYMWQYYYNLRGLFEAPHLPADDEHFPPQRKKVEQIIRNAREAGRTTLSEAEALEILKAYHIPVVETIVAKEETEAIRAAKKLGFPVVLKLLGAYECDEQPQRTIQLNLKREAAVREGFETLKKYASEVSSECRFEGVIVQPMVPFKGYELILQSFPDNHFGPIVLFGSGGELLNIYKDRTLALPPLNSTLARRMMERTQIYRALLGEEDCLPVNLELLEQCIIRFSQLIVEQRWIREITIKPLLASSEHVLALNAHMTLYPSEVSKEELPRPAIRPYPLQYKQTATLKDGTPVTIRPIRPEDEPGMIKFHEKLSDQSVYLRYFHPIALRQRVQHERLARICFIDYDREMV